LGEEERLKNIRVFRNPQGKRKREKKKRKKIK